MLAMKRETTVGSTEAGEARPVADRDASRLSRVDCALRQAGRQALRRVQIYVDESQVTLRGRVRSYYEKQLAQHVTLSLEGVRSVKNQLTVG